MSKKWIVATYKINEINRLEENLVNQNIHYYLPKITIKKINSSITTESLFPGYVFINIDIENYQTLSFTKGIKKIIKFGETIPFMPNSEIKLIRAVEESSKSKPIISQIKVGQDVLITKGSLKGNVVKICSIPAKDRVIILLSLLGSLRRVSILERDLIFKKY